MVQYFRTPEMQAGKGFRCYNCSKLLALKMDGDCYRVVLSCPRCHALIQVKMGEPLPWKGDASASEAKT